MIKERKEKLKKLSHDDDPHRGLSDEMEIRLSLLDRARAAESAIKRLDKDEMSVGTRSAVERIELSPDGYAVVRAVLVDALKADAERYRREASEGAPADWLK